MTKIGLINKVEPFEILECTFSSKYKEEKLLGFFTRNVDDLLLEFVSFKDGRVKKYLDTLVEAEKIQEEDKDKEKLVLLYQEKEEAKETLKGIELDNKLLVLFEMISYYEEKIRRKIDGKNNGNWERNNYASKRNGRNTSKGRYFS